MPPYYNNRSRSGPYYRGQQYYAKSQPSMAPAFEAKFKLPDSLVSFDISERNQVPLLILKNFEGRHFITLKEVEVEDLFVNMKRIRRMFAKCRSAMQKYYNASGNIQDRAKIKEVSKSQKHKRLEEESKRTTEIEEDLTDQSLSSDNEEEESEIDQQTLIKQKNH